MELLFIPLFFFYVSAFEPEFFASVFPFAFIFFIPLLISLRWQKLDLFSLSFLLMFLLFCNGYDSRNVNFSFSSDSCDGYYCKIISQPAGRDRRRKGFNVSLIAQKDLSGNVYSASGVLYAIGDDLDMNIFDVVYLSGYIDQDVIFYTQSDIIIQSMFSQVRKELITGIRNRLYLSRSSSLMQLLILGSSDYGGNDIGDKASKAGLRHVIALSGMHLAALSILLFPLRLLGKNVYGFSEIVAMIIFTFLSGWRASLLRALIFRILARFGFKVEESFLLSAIVLLLIFPYYAFDLGAIYSFIALSGILILTTHLADSLSCFFPKSVSFLLSTSMSALLFSAPISLHTFGYYQLSSILTSIPIGPLVLIYMILSIVYLFFPSTESLSYIFYKAIEWILSLNIIPVQEGLGEYIIFLSITVALLFFKIFHSMRYQR